MLAIRAKFDQISNLMINIPTKFHEDGIKTMPAIVLTRFFVRFNQVT